MSTIHKNSTWEWSRVFIFHTAITSVNTYVVFIVCNNSEKVIKSTSAQTLMMPTLKTTELTMKWNDDYFTSRYTGDDEMSQIYNEPNWIEKPYH